MHLDTPSRLFSLLADVKTLNCIVQNQVLQLFLIVPGNQTDCHPKGGKTEMNRLRLEGSFVCAGAHYRFLNTYLK